MNRLLPSATMAATILGAIAFAGCFGGGIEADVQVEFRSLYREDLYIEEWVSENPDEVGRRSIGPNDGRPEHRYNTSFDCTGDRHPHLNVILKEYTGTILGVERRTVDSKTWVIPDCDPTYTVIIDQQARMNLYKCGLRDDLSNPCPVEGPAIEPMP